VPEPTPVPPAVEAAQVAALEPQIIDPTPQSIEAAQLPAPEVFEPAPVAALEPQIVEVAPQSIEVTPLAQPAQAVEAAPAPETPATVLASVLPPPANSPIIVSVPERTLAPTETTVASAAAPVAPAAPATQVSAVVPPPPAPPPANLGRELTWRGYVPAGTLV